MALTERYKSDSRVKTFRAAAGLTVAFGTTCNQNAYMNFEPIPKTDWWHERPTKTADLSTSLRAVASARAKREAVWKKSALVVGLMFALILSLISLACR